MVQNAAVFARPQHAGQVVHAARRKMQARWRGQEPRGVRHRRHFDGAFGAIQKAVEHLRVEVARRHHFGGEAVVGPDGVGRGRVEFRQILGALAGRHDLEAAGARPVDHFADQGGLVAVGQRIHDACFARAARQQRPGQGIGFHVDHDDVLAVFAAGQHVGDAGGGLPGGVDDDVDLGAGDDGKRVVAEENLAVLQRVIGAAGIERAGRPAHPGQGGAGAVGRQIGHRHQPHARRARGLAHEHGAELSGAQQCNTQRLVVGFSLLEQTVQIHSADSSGVGVQPAQNSPKS
ncbi:hypothetical protein D3C85_912200 [compost metagenome]